VACPELVEGACPELVEGACPELVEGFEINCIYFIASAFDKLSASSAKQSAPNM